MNDRLKQFRQYMARLDPAADPHFAIERGFYVPSVGRTLIDEVAGRLELHPGSTHLVVGGIGSGKTTQLLMATKRLSKLADTTAQYIDVSTKHDISALEPQLLLVLAGLALDRMVKVPINVELSEARKVINRAARGYTDLVTLEENEEAYQRAFDLLDTNEDVSGNQYVHTAGILKPPPTQAPPAAPPSQLVTSLRLLWKSVAQRVPHLVFLFDALDRVVDLEGFEQLVTEDVRVLQSLGIGVVLVGPLKLLYGTYRPIAQRFDTLHQVQWTDPNDLAGRNFLLRVLKARAPKDLLADDGAIRLVELSGGVLRDLVGLARNAGEEAYLSGDAQITAAHSDAAGETFGRTLLLGLGSDDLAKLQSVRKNSTFVPVTDKDLALLMTGRVLEYRGSKTRYAVHPTIRPLLEQLAAENP